MQLTDNQRHDPPCGSNEIELAPSAGRACPPLRVQRDAASKSALKYDDAASRLEVEVRAKQAAVAELRAKAIEAKQYHDDLAAEVERLTTRLERAEGEIPRIKSRLKELEAQTLRLWEANEDTSDHIAEHQRRSFVLTLLPDLVKQTRARLSEVQKELNDFEKSEGIAP